jgi:2-oxoglutarate dehydrogenase E2 component (dihydrolipoamide succinyltransferase)
MVERESGPSINPGSTDKIGEMNAKMVEIKIPELGESIQEVQIAHWLKQEGDWVESGEDLVELESEKASQALPAPSSGVLQKILARDGQFVPVGEVIAHLDPQGKPSTKNGAEEKSAGTAQQPSAKSAKSAEEKTKRPSETRAMPAAERLMHEQGIEPSSVEPSGPGGRILKEDVQRAAKRDAEPRPERPTDGSRRAPTQPKPAAEKKPQPVSPPEPVATSEQDAESRQEKVAPMSMIRRTIANRLVEAQQTAALLTTFNEVDMQPVMELRKKYQEAFQAKHGVKLGFMSFFAKASVEALKRFPAVNSEIRGNDVVSRNFYDIGIAIGGGKGLVVPVLRNVQRMSFAEIEREIGRFGQLAQENKLKPTDLEGGTFTISNGGIYGSLLSTPIVNPPQSGILGLHAIQQRPVAIEGQVVIRPMMYVALTYDHRIVDGREAVSFLKTIKDVLEEPARLFLEV